MVILDIPEEFYITGLTNNIDLLDRIVVMADEVTWLRWQYQRQQFHKNNPVNNNNNGMVNHSSNDFSPKIMNKSNRKRFVAIKPKLPVPRMPKLTPEVRKSIENRPTVTPPSSGFKRRRKAQLPQRTTSDQQYYLTDDVVELDDYRSNGNHGDSSPSIINSDYGADNLRIIESSVRSCGGDDNDLDLKDVLSAPALSESSMPDDSVSQHSNESPVVVENNSSENDVQQGSAAEPVIVEPSDVIRSMLNDTSPDLNGNQTNDDMMGEDISIGPNSCLECGRSFESANSLYAHMKSHAVNRPYICLICNKTFTQASSLNRHKQIHTGERPFQCPECGKGFSRRYQLNNHFEFAHKDIIIKDESLHLVNDSNESPQSS